MPSTTVKSLYIAQGMKELESKSSVDNNIKIKGTNSLVNSANKIFHAAEMSDLDKDEEKAYVQFTRFIELVIVLQKRSDFKQNSECKKLMLNANAALIKAERLKTSLLKRYSILDEANCRIKNERNDLISALHNNKTDIAAPTELVVKEEPSEKPEIVEHSISSPKLFDLMTNSMSQIHMFDTRSEKDFDKSHIRHSNCVNIPKEILKPGTTALKLEQILPGKALGTWKTKSKADYIILIDLDSKDETSMSEGLQVLKLALTKWDMNYALKRPPLVLQGGYKDWMLRYPMFTTQVVNFSYNEESEPSSVIADLSAIEYPNLDEPDHKPAPNKETHDSSEPAFTRLNNSIPRGSGTKSAPTIDRKSKPAATPKSASSIPRPVVLPKDNREKELDSSTEEVEKLARKNLQLAEERLAKEQEFEKLRMRREVEAEESKRAELQKKEESLVAALKKLELESKKKEEEYAKVCKENEKLKKMLEKGNSTERHSSKDKEIIEAEKKKKIMMEDVERMREQRKKLEMEKKINDVTKTTNIPRDVVSANSGLKRNSNQQDKSNAGNSEAGVSLSRQSSTSGSGHGLVRSHSSPNIAQMVNQELQSPKIKTPTVDRSLKPKPTTPTFNFNEIHRARSRNLNPVHGVCHVRPATGLRNLGNTCFMNSIIQCLSNTKPLADYFTTGQYVKDINRNSKYGSGGEVVEEFATVIINLWMGQYKSISPKDFKNTVSKCLSVCIGNEQQDSHEFMVVLMEKLHADLNRNSVRSGIPKLEANADDNTFWRHHKSYNLSIISETFEGLLKSTLTCLSCLTTSDSFEVFSCLSLPILTNKCSLKECFQHFLKPERLSGEAAWDCPKCKTKKDAEKRLRICRFPEILVIQLKRFSYEGLWRRKLQTNVDFDSHFCMPFEHNSEHSNQKYLLYGVVNHFGTLEGGHYTAFCKNFGTQKWFKYDDHEVYEMSSSDVKTSAAYLLFYQRLELLSAL